MYFGFLVIWFSKLEYKRACLYLSKKELVFSLVWILIFKSAQFLLYFVFSLPINWIFSDLKVLCKIQQIILISYPPLKICEGNFWKVLIFFLFQNCNYMARTDRHIYPYSFRVHNKMKKRKEQITKDAPTFFLFIIFVFDFRWKMPQLNFYFGKNFLFDICEGTIC